MPYRPIAATAVVVGLLNLAAIPPAHAATPSCSGPTVARADIDGDGRRDTVTVRPAGGHEFAPRTRLCVKTATGRVSTVTDTASSGLYSDSAFFGVAGLDGARGHEIVLHAGTGAHVQFFHVYTWRNGRLARENAPDSRDAEWTIDGAVTVIKGYRFSTVRGVRQVVSTIADKSPDATVYRARQTTYRWSKGGWVRGATRTVMMPADSRAASASYGWSGVTIR